MPYIKMNTNLQLNDEVKKTVCRKAAELITLLSGKEVNKTMTELCDQNTMYFDCSYEPLLNIHIDLHQKSDLEEKRAYCKALCEMIEQETGIPKERMFIIFAEHENWGWAGLVG